MQRASTLNPFVLTLVILILITLIYKPSLVSSSPVMDDQVIPNFSKWTLNTITYNNVTIHDGRTLFFHTATDISKCEMESLPKLSSVTYLSDGKTLNTTYWLSKPRLNGTFALDPFLNDTQIHQSLLNITTLPSKNATLSDLIQKENSSLTEQGYSDLKVIQSTLIKLDNNQAHKLVFTGKDRTYFGNFGITAIEVLMIKNGKIYTLISTTEKFF